MLPIAQQFAVPAICATPVDIVPPSVYGYFLLAPVIDYALMYCVTESIVKVNTFSGGIIAGELPMLILLVTKMSAYILLVPVAYVLIQIAGNHLIIPKVVASNVNINTLTSVVALSTGGWLWGIPGMLHFILLNAIPKMILEYVESLRHREFLLGSFVPTE